MTSNMHMQAQDLQLCSVFVPCFLRKSRNANDNRIFLCKKDAECPKSLAPPKKKKSCTSNQIKRNMKMSQMTSRD